MIIFAKIAVFTVLATSSFAPTIAPQEASPASNSVVVGTFSGSVGSLAGF